MHGWRHVASWVVEARMPFSPWLCLEVREACMDADILSHVKGLPVNVDALSRLEACMVGGTLSHE